MQCEDRYLWLGTGKERSRVVTHTDGLLAVAAVGVWTLVASFALGCFFFSGSELNGDEKVHVITAVWKVWPAIMCARAPRFPGAHDLTHARYKSRLWRLFGLCYTSPVIDASVHMLEIMTITSQNISYHYH